MDCRKGTSQSVQWIVVGTLAALVMCGWGGTGVLAADAPVRKASTILSSPFVWPNGDINDMVRNGVITAATLSMVQSGAGLPWETQQSNKKLCATERLMSLPDRIELRVGEHFPISNLVLRSSAFGDFYFDAAITRKWKHENAVFVFDRSTMTLRAVSAGVAELPVDSLCKSKRLSSPLPTLSIPVLVSP